MRSVLKAPPKIAAMSICMVCLVGLAIAVDVQKIQRSWLTKFGAESSQLAAEWGRLITDLALLSEADKLRRVNDFVNQRISFEDDTVVWGQKDHWATPGELFSRGRGDCEDYTIAKYYSLREAGMSASKLRLVYVRAMQSVNGEQQIQAHMVLAYFSAATSEPVILDNLVPLILPASKRADLVPVFSFNSNGLWLGTGNQSSRNSLSRWQDLVQRAQLEGFE